MDNVTTESSVAEENKCAESEVLCLMRVGRNSDWLHLVDNTEVQFAKMLTSNLRLPSAKLRIQLLLKICSAFKGCIFCSI